MRSELISRRAVALALVVAAGLSVTSAPAWAAAAMATAKPEADDGLTSMAESIHQQIRFSAARRRVYQALLEPKQFESITRLSDAAALLDAADAKPTMISRDVGGSFTLFGGYVIGRNLEMVRDERLVQAWRAQSWDPGAYSIATFSLFPDGEGTRLVFDHRGFPSGQGAHLAAGWRTHYWEPLAKFLS